MYILYLDDSGSPINPNEEYFVLGGVCVPEQSVRWLSYEIEKLAERLVPRNSSGVEFHASEIFGGRENPWNTMHAPADRIAVIKNVLLTLQAAYADIVTFACAVHKASYLGQDPVHVAFEDISSRFNLFLERAGSTTRGLIVLDKTVHETSLQKLAIDFRRTGNTWGRQLRNICEVPLFVDSKATRLIQLADHVAYAVFRRYNAGDLNYFNCIENRFDSDPTTGTIHGLSHLHANRHTCTCPACLSRRS
ncbi:MAG: DUF3800 domain-containing protein [Caldilineaceae bacterium]|nr:DUF3800 domain-containing protein [Caldilineaceae bacterium]